MPAPASSPRRVSVVTLGCGRNEVDSEELAARLTSQGWEIVDDSAEPADVVMVNTCGFIDAAKKDSVDTVLAAADTGAAVVAVGCMAERYGEELARALPEADGVLGFDDYADIGARLDDVLAGRAPVPRKPADRRPLLPITPVERPAAAAGVSLPGHGGGPAAQDRDRHDDLPEGVAPASGPRVLRRRLSGGPVAPLKLASGCDRRCTFCAIPSFRGAFVSRPPEDLLAEAAWLGADGVRELVLVSENSTSYGKDLRGDVRSLEPLLPRLAAAPDVRRVRVSYLQPAELRPELLRAVLTTPGVAAYLDLSFQHASEPVLRRMRRFGSTERFLQLLADGRALRPGLGARSNFIVGFPGETDDDVAELERFLAAARLDAIGVFGYSDESGTEAEGYADKVPADEIAERVERLTSLAEELTAQRAEERIGELVEVLVEDLSEDLCEDFAGDFAGDFAEDQAEDLAEDLGDTDTRAVGASPAGTVEGRAEHQAPEIDGTTTLTSAAGLRVGDIVRARVTGSTGVDLIADPIELVEPGDPPGSTGVPGAV